MPCPKGTYEDEGGCYGNEWHDWVQFANTSVVVKVNPTNVEISDENEPMSDNERLTMWFGTAENRPIHMVTSLVFFLFSAFMVWYFYQRGRSFWVYLFGAFAAYDLIHFIVSTFGLHLKKTQ